MAPKQPDDYTVDELEALLAAEQAEDDNQPEDDPQAREEITTYSGFADMGATPRYLDDETIPYEDSLG